MTGRIMKIGFLLGNRCLKTLDTHNTVNNRQASYIRWIGDEIRPTIRAIGKLTAKRFEVAKTTG